MRMRPVSLILALLCFVAPAAMAASSEEARSWIKRMNEAVVNRNYDGVLEHRWNGGGREMLRVIHRMKDGRMSERVVFLGTNNEIVRNGSNHVEFYHSKRIAKAQKLTRSYGYISAFNGISADSDRFYVISNGGSQRLKDYPKPTQLITLEPRDGLRYGYRFWLDQQSHLPIRTQLVSATGVVLDEVFFHSLSLPETIEDAMLEPSANPRGYTWRKPDESSSGVKRAFLPRDSLLPPGFRDLKLGERDAGNESGRPVTRFIISDGIAWVSVLVSASGQSQDVGLTKEPGPGTFAYVNRLDGHYITVVGEVPPATVKAIAEAFRPE